MSERTIPKKIHYCWFGYGEKNDLIKKCIASWEKYFPDYEIIEWNESNFDINQNIYCQEAYSCKKWAFVSDYARLFIVYRYGGIYFDTDVEVIKRFDHLLDDYGYLCYEHISDNPSENCVATGLGFAARPGSEIVKLMLREYDDIHFCNNNEWDLKPCPFRNTVALVKAGLVQNGQFQILGDMKIYPYEYFCGFDMLNYHPNITANTYTVHHYSASWKEEYSIWKKIKYQVVLPTIQRVFGYRLYDGIKKVWTKNRKL